MADPTSAIVESLKAIKLIPDLLPTSLIETDKWAPSVLFSIVYPNAEIVLGEEIQRDLTIDEPDIVFSPLNIPFKDDQESYTLVMYDPDAPSKADPKYKSFRHWVIPGIMSSVPSTTDETSNLKALKTKPSITPYRPPGPPPGSGLHRYLFLLFSEPVGFTVPEGAKEYGAELEQRRSWDGLVFAKEYGLKLVGATWFGVRSEKAQ